MRGMVLAAALVAAATPALAQGRPTLTLFEGANFTGQTVTLEGAILDFGLIGFNDRARSAQAVGRWIICEDNLFGGGCQTLEGSAPDLGGLAGRISSARPAAGPDSQTDRVSAGLPQGFPAQGVRLFSAPGFTGEQRAVLQAAPDLRSTGFNDRAFSIRVAPGQAWRLCAERAYRGACQVISADIADLRAIGLGGALSSLRPEAGTAAPAWTQPGLTLFEFENFSGRRIQLAADSASLVAAGFNDVARSAQVGPGETWQVCQDIRFGGQCASLTGPQPTLGWMTGMASSARRIAGPAGAAPPAIGAPDTEGGAPGRTAAFFARPTLNGQAVPACAAGSSTDRACVQRTADAFCRLAGHVRAAYWAIGADDRLEDLLCTRQ